MRYFLFLLILAGLAGCSDPKTNTPLTGEWQFHNFDSNYVEWYVTPDQIWVYDEMNGLREPIPYSLSNDSLILGDSDYQRLPGRFIDQDSYEFQVTLFKQNEQGELDEIQALHQPVRIKESATTLGSHNDPEKTGNTPAFRDAFNERMLLYKKKHQL